MRIARLLLPLTLTFALVGCQEFLRSPEQQQEIDRERNEERDEEVEGMMIEDGDPSNDDDDMVEETSSDVSSVPPMEPESSSARQPVDGSYGEYSPSVLVNGQTKVLFFHAAWCPICRNADVQLTAWYKTHPFPISVYKVDYDTETELRQRYGVTYQHTYVLVDGDGDPLKVLEAPTDAQLQGMLQA